MRVLLLFFLFSILFFTQVAVIGFCMGGALSLGCAVKHPEIDACIAFYGWNDGLADVSTMTKPTQVV